MGVQIDLIVPPIILGLLIILIFNVNAFILETSVDNRLTNDMQTFADVTVDIVQEELRGLVELSFDDAYKLTVVEEEDEDVGSVTPKNYYSRLEFTMRQNGYEDEVEIWAEDGILHIKKYGEITTTEETVVYPGYIEDIMFIVEDTLEPRFVTVKVTTESRPEMHARFGNDENLVRAFAEKRIFLRNLGL